MAFYVVYLKCKKYVALKKEWIQNPVVGQVSKVFISADTSLNADFNAEKSFFLVENNMCYDGFVEKMYENLESAHRFIEKKRTTAPVFYKTGKKFQITKGEIVDTVCISDDEEMESVAHELNGNAASVLRTLAQPVSVSIVEIVCTQND